MQITQDDFKGLVDFQAHEDLVQHKLNELVVAYNDGNPFPMVKFFSNYISWNGYFAGGVCGLTANICASRNLFRQPDITIDAVADRANYVASFIYDAARDEFNSSSRIRDPHRSLSQAFLLRMMQIVGINYDYNTILAESEELHQLNLGVLDGYNGRGSFRGHNANNRQCVYSGMGFHAGSEILADAEFTMIDRFFKQQMYEFWPQLKGHTVNLHGCDLNTYAWVAIHSGDGGGVEQDHFDLALVGIREALKFTPEAYHPECIEAIKSGFARFAKDHETFFKMDVLE